MRSTYQECTDGFPMCQAALAVRCKLSLYRPIPERHSGRCIVAHLCRVIGALSRPVQQRQSRSGSRSAPRLNLPLLCNQYGC